MSSEKLQFTLGHNNVCQNPDCGHTYDERPFVDDYIHRNCTVCDCESYEFLTRLNPISDVTMESLTGDIQISNVNLEKQIDELEDRVGKTQKEKEELIKKLKRKDAANKKLKIKNKELEYKLGLLKLDLQISENIKRNLKHLLDQKEE